MISHNQRVNNVHKAMTNSDSSGTDLTMTSHHHHQLYNNANTITCTI